MGAQSPDDYRRMSGYRRSSANGMAITAPHASWAYDNNPLSEDLVFEDMLDPRLAAFMGGGRSTAAGVHIGQHIALRDSTFFRAINLIASAVGMLPVHLMRRLDNGDTEEARDHPLFGVLHRKPNDYQTALEFKSQMQTAALLDGNAYALVIRGFKGRIVSLVPLKRGSVTPLLSDDFQLTFRYERPNGGQVILPARDIFHFRSMVTVDGLRGIALLDVAAQALGIAVQAERAAARLFKNGMLAGGSLQTDQTLGPEAIENLKQSLEERYSGADNAGKFLILEEGLKLVMSTMSPKDSQHLETRKHQAEELARFTGVPRPLLMFDETSWGTGIGQLGQFFVTYCLGAWFVAWEQAIERCLDPGEQGVLYPKFNDGALLRGSPTDQASFFSKALGAGGSQAWMTPNEVRANFEQNKIEGGDELPERMADKGGAEDPPADPTGKPPAKESQ
ncbi:phage portal protein [Sphingomonas sp. TREG-RG-20F-R18-01]|uniref:phage portal protein n=1 Tax=Sphingomonas sp. TREG-RG-20F-R18-01 TaxID=2914982 RepID=UPI001F5AE76E|nr:phage portal protein [Sphingomonas sp. TREG-RG-20F-R18-01]